MNLNTTFGKKGEIDDCSLGTERRGGRERGRSRSGNAVAEAFVLLKVAGLNLLALLMF